MKRLTKICTIGLSLLALCTTVSSIQSCQSHEDMLTSTDDKDASEFLSSLKRDYDSVLSSESVPYSRSLDVNKTGTKVYVNKSEIKPLDSLNCNAQIAYQIDAGSVVATKQLFELMSDFDVTISATKTDETPDSLYVDEAEIKASLMPMVEDCRAYLHSKDMTDSEIDEMLQEYGADESVLIPLVISLSEYENSESSEANLQKPLQPLLPIFGVRAYAGDINWTKVGGCAMRAIGLDLAQLGLNRRILKAGIKMAFKAIAKEMLGPVSALIVIGEFIACYY
jgi:hypothetical protein